MQNGNGSEALKILVVTEDRMLQRELSSFFELVGYTAFQAADPGTAIAAVDAASPQLVLIDAEAAVAADWELCRQLSRRSAGGFRFLLVEEPDESDLQQALEAGIDDFLLKPISHGELLSRVRAAVRVLEYDRRVGQQGRIDSLTGLLTQSAFTAHLRRQLSERHGTSPRVACIVLDVDFFARAERAAGRAAADELLQALARELNRLRAGSEVLGRMGGDRFCVMLPGADEATASQWAETAREALHAAAFELSDESWRFSASFGVAGCAAGESAADLLNRASSALETAKHLGRNCVVSWSTHQSDAAAVPPGSNLLEGTTARDVMTPCTAFLRPDDTVGDALELVTRTTLDGVPVVDEKGKLLGLFEPARGAEVAEDDYPTRTAGDVMTRDTKTFEAGDSLANLAEHFHTDAGTIAMVCLDGRPAGFVTADSLVALSRPADFESLAADRSYSDTSDYLLVPDVRPLECDTAV